MSKGGVIYQLLKKLPSNRFNYVNGKCQYSWQQSAADGNANGHLLPKSDTKPKQQSHRTSGRHLCMIMFLAFLSMLAVGSLLSPHLPYTADGCGGYFFFSSSRCSTVISADDDQDQLVVSTPTIKQREFNTDEEINARLSYKEILSVELPRPKNPKIAFMFLSVSTLPFEKLWDMFFQGNEGKFSVFVHASELKPTHTSKYFINSTIRSDTVEWGKISMVDAERRLLAQAFKDPDNWHFVLLSDSCVPLHTFDYVYTHLIESNISFVSRYQDPGVYGSGRYIDYMLPEVEYTDFMKGSQWFAVKRQHALLILADSLYYTKFKLHCKPGMEGDRNCYSDEHYLPTFFYMIDPTGIANWSVTHVDWSERKWHPKEYSEAEVTFDLLKKITSIDVNVHITSEEEYVEKRDTCMWNGRRKPCYLFARKFDPDSLQNLIDLFPMYESLEQPTEV